MVMSSTRELFGGAITVSLPSKLIDASDLRQIPDTQEVFLDPKTDLSIVVEVLESVEATDVRLAATFHFESLAHDNSAVSSAVHDTAVLSARQPDISALVILTGTQHVPKFNTTTPDEVQIFLAMYRISSKNVDLVLTMNVPTKAADGGALSQTELAEAKKAFEAAAHSLHITDFGLFA